jgi:hypothetical protein
VALEAAVVTGFDGYDVRVLLVRCLAELREVPAAREHLHAAAQLLPPAEEGGEQEEAHLRELEDLSLKLEEMPLDG